MLALLVVLMKTYLCNHTHLDRIKQVPYSIFRFEDRLLFIGKI